MVFSRLSADEKDAFFSLLDEYFASRPDIFAGALAPVDSDNATPSQASADTPGGAAASAVHRALASNPEATSRLISAGLKHGVPKSSPYAAAAHNEDINSSVGRVAAASLAFSANNSNSNRLPPPSAPPRRVSSSSSSSTDPPARTPSATEKTESQARGLLGNRKFGDLDTSSAKGFYGSLRNSTANKTQTQTPPPPPPVVPSGFAARKNEFAPPPVRRVPAEAVSSSRQAEQEDEEEEAGGEWAEALYDYTSSDAGDLELQAKQRVLVVEKTSDDWWTGELDGRRGLFPASYVKLL